MKKLLIALSTILSTQAFSQYIIDENDFGVQGDEIIYGVDSLYADDLNNIGMIGDSLEWNFLDLGALFEDTVRFESPSTYSNKFNGSDFAYNAPLFIQFMSVDMNEVRIDGLESPFSSLIDTGLLDSTIVSNLPDELSFRYAGGLPYIKLPAQLNDSDLETVNGSFTFYYGDTISIPGSGAVQVDSIRIRETVEYESYIEGEGIVVLPNGDYNAIKQFSKYRRSYSVDVGTIVPILGIFWVEDIFPIPFSITEINHRWLGKGHKFPLVEITTDSAQTFLNARYQTAPSGGQVSINEKFNYNIKYTINNNLINVELKPNVKNVILSDITGKRLLNSESSFTYAFKERGMYFISYITSRGELITKKILI